MLPGPLHSKAGVPGRIIDLMYTLSSLYASGVMPFSVMWFEGLSALVISRDSLSIFVELKLGV